MAGPNLHQNQLISVWFFPGFPHWYLNFCTGKYAKKGIWGMGQCQQNQDVSKKHVRGKARCFLHLRIIREVTGPPSQHLITSKVNSHLWSLRCSGVWTNNISDFWITRFKKKTVFLNYVRTPFRKLIYIFQIWAPLRYSRAFCTFFVCILQFPSWQGTCYNQKYIRRNKKLSFRDSELVGSQESQHKQSQTHNTVDTQGTPK